MYALGHAGLPATVDAAGVTYELERTVKHDFWAATGFYLPAPGSPADARRVVVKINRRVGMLGLPLRWTGWKLRRREVRAYAKLQDLPNVPRLLGPVADTGFVHSYVEGEPLRKGRAVPDGFFDELMRLIDTLNERKLAYLDTNKPENILLGNDGRPYLIDFQISLDADAWWPRWLGRWMLRSAYRADVYHVLKQKKRFRPDLVTAAELQRIEDRGWAIRLHRALTKPYFMIRRPIMRRLERGGWIGPELSK